MTKLPWLAKVLPAAVVAAWWMMFLGCWAFLDDAVDERNGHLEPTPDGDFAAGGDPVNADWD